MAHHDYLIRYSNGFKRHVSRAELATHSGLEQLGPREYLSKASLQHSLEETNGPRYLSGSWIIELKGERYKDLAETPRGMIGRLEAMGWKAEQVQA